MKKLLLMLSVVVLTSAIPFHQLNVKYGPWISNVSETGFTVNWMTDYKALSHVEIALDDGSAFESKVRDKYYQTKFGRRYTGKEHHVEITGLEPGTSYRYRVVVTEVEDDTNPYASDYGRTRAHKEIAGVRTLDNSKTDYRIAMFNDIHCNEQKLSDLARGLDPESLDLILLNGDIVSDMGAADSLVKHLYMPLFPLSSRVPSIYARGNHESRGRYYYKFMDYFPTSTGEPYYTFRMGQIAFIVLDGGEDKPDTSPEYSNTAAYDDFRREQLEWLKDELKRPEIADAPVKIAVMHIPSVIFPGSWYTQKWLAENFNPVLSAAGIDLMVSGHHHKYIFVEPGQCGNDFPVLINSNTERLDIIVKGESIKLQTVNLEGEVSRTVNL